MDQQTSLFQFKHQGIQSLLEIKQEQNQNMDKLPCIRRTRTTKFVHHLVMCRILLEGDIARLLKQRFDFPGVQNPLDAPDANGRINTVKNVNDFTIIVQEYFQKRVQNWLKTVGKKVFMIKHYWLRYEFAPSRVKYTRICW